MRARPAKRVYALKRQRGSVLRIKAETNLFRVEGF
jgi:hypothetical protein